MTRLIDSPPWRASNSNVSPDGKWLAFMVNTYTSEPGFGMGLGLINLLPPLPAVPCRTSTASFSDKPMVR